MKHLASGNTIRTAAVVVLTLVMAANVAASPAVNGAIINARIFNDCPSSVLTTTNTYPGQIVIDDQNLSCGGFANLHNWHLSIDGGASDAVFNNGDSFRLACDLVITGTGGEGGLQVAPWWAQDVDGRFNVRSTDGEIACFGGRLPFYSFTASQGLTYVAGTTIRLEVVYFANSLSPTNPATIEYKILYNSMNYTSGALPFDQGNPAESPPYGLWGMLNEARVGGYVQAFLQGGNPAAGVTATYSEIVYEDLGTIAVESQSWGQVKSMFND